MLARRALGVAVVLIAAGASPAGAADEAPRRKVAVLEYRGGVDNAPDLAAEIAAHLKRAAALDVVDLREARRRHPTIDSEVARCAGDAACTARAGRKLAVDEVLLVAMSQLGDLVVNLQRIEVATAKPAVPPISAVLPTGSADKEKIDGWVKQLFPPGVFIRHGRIAVTSDVTGAVVSLNGKVMGETPLDGPFTVSAPRGYKVSVTKEGRVPFTLRIEVPPDVTVTVNAPLPKEQADTPWYKRWYPWAIFGAVAVGAGVGTAVYLTTRPCPDCVDTFSNLPPQHP